MAKKVEKVPGNQPIPGHPQGFTPEELKADNQKQVEQKIRIIKDLNKIQHPLNVTIFQGPSAWTIRNIAFYKALQQKDEKVLEFMHKYLKEEK